MKRLVFSAFVFVSLLFVLLPATAMAAMWDVPVGPGETFRWVFVTSGRLQATSRDIGEYNKFVNEAAEAADTLITGVVGKPSIAEISWKAIVSTETSNAIDNIGTSPAGIYTPMGHLVASGTTDMFDGSLIAPITITENGDTYQAEVWTGSSVEGLAFDSIWMGKELVSTGHAASITNSWICYSSIEGFLQEHPLYAISEEITVIPSPGALLLTAIGLLSSTPGLKRWRRKHP